MPMIASSTNAATPPHTTRSTFFHVQCRHQLPYSSQSLKRSPRLRGSPPSRRPPPPLPPTASHRRCRPAPAAATDAWQVGDPGSGAAADAVLVCPEVVRLPRAARYGLRVAALAAVTVIAGIGISAAAAGAPRRPRTAVASRGPPWPADRWPRSHRRWPRPPPGQRRSGRAVRASTVRATHRSSQHRRAGAGRSGRRWPGPAAASAAAATSAAGRPVCSASRLLSG